MKSKANRIWGIAVGLVGLGLCLFALASVLSYFNTGAEEISKYDLGVHQLSDHNPQVTWLADDKNIKGEINQYTRTEIEESYIDAWGILNLSIANQEDLGLSENFTKTKVSQIKESFYSNSSINRSDLNHNLKLHFISYDKQIVSFTDFNMEMETNLTSTNYQYTYRDTSSYAIVMTLQDGKWKINKFQRKINN